MNIGVDIDDTITYTTDTMIKYADKYSEEVLKEKYKVKVLGSIADSHYLNSLYGWDKNTKIDFFSKYYENIIKESKVIENVSNALTNLKSQGNNIYFVTARMTDVVGCDTIGITKKMLKENNIPYDDVIFDAKEKIEYANKLNIDIFIDDCFAICKSLEKNNIKTLLMTTKVNDKIETNIERVSNWNEVYERINEYSKEKR